MIKQLELDLGMKLPHEPIEARDFLQKFINSEKNKLLIIINALQLMHDSDEIDKAWKFIKELKSDLEMNKENEESVGEVNIGQKMMDSIDSLMKYAELAVFFYTLGVYDFSIEWSF